MFKEAIRQKTKARILLYGSSGSGKSFTALKIASYLGDTTVVINSELAGPGIGSSELYANSYPHMSGIIEPPYHPKAFITAINEAVTAGADTVIVDSCSHEWFGALSLLETLQKKSKNKLAPWGDVTPLHNDFLGSMINCPVHIIFTARAEDKTGFDENGKIVKYMDKIQQRNGNNFKSEFNLTVFVSEGTHGTIEKTRYSEFVTGQKFNLDEEEMYTLIWSALDNGVKPPPTLKGFQAILAQSGYRTKDEIASLKNQVEGMNIAWSPETHDQLVETFVNHVKE